MYPRRNLPSHKVEGMSSVGRQVQLGIVSQLYQKFLEQTLMLMGIKVNKSRKDNKSVKLSSILLLQYCILLYTVYYNTTVYYCSIKSEGITCKCLCITYIKYTVLANSHLRDVQSNDLLLSRGVKSTYSP